MKKNKYKVVVYAITKNEEKFAKRWYESMKEADEIYVLDTGSDDNTVNILKNLGANVVVKEIKPWRFDTARNLSLDLVPQDTDICVCTDLDEVFDKGWRNNLEMLWEKYDINHLGYNYNWSFDINGNPAVNFYISKIHSRDDYKWKHPVHEVLININNNEKLINTDDITLNHYPDNTKSRSSYLPLLELSVQEDPEDDRNMHYLGREYMYYKKWQNAIDTLTKHLDMPNATWKDERCASMRFIARSYINLKGYDNAIKWYNKAIEEAPYLRDPYVEKALLMYELKDYNQVIYLCNKALDIQKNGKSYINETFSYDHTIYDLLSLCHYYKGDKHLALYYVDKAICMSPNNERLKNNKIFFEKMEEV